jgi:hypothetical protein
MAAIGLCRAPCGAWPAAGGAQRTDWRCHCHRGHRAVAGDIHRTAGPRRDDADGRSTGRTGRRGRGGAGGPPDRVRGTGARSGHDVAAGVGARLAERRARHGADVRRDAQRRHRVAVHRAAPAHRRDPGEGRDLDVDVEVTWSRDNECRLAAASIQEVVSATADSLGIDWAPVPSGHRCPAVRPTTRFTWRGSARWG